MSIQAQVALRSRKLAVLIQDARLSAHKTIPECAAAIGVDEAVWQSWESGEASPSLPELEVLAFSLHQPLEHFWGKTARSVEQSASEKLNLPVLERVRQRIVGALLRQQREKAGVSLDALAAQTGLTASDLEAYELGENPIPLPVLEALLNLLGGRVESLFDKTGPVGQWMAQQKAIQEFLQLPPELQTFISRPINRPYLSLALKLSEMSTEKLRSVAEDLLEITL